MQHNIGPEWSGRHQPELIINVPTPPMGPQFSAPEYPGDTSLPAEHDPYSELPPPSWAGVDQDRPATPPDASVDTPVAESRVRLTESIVERSTPATEPTESTGPTAADQFIFEDSGDTYGLTPVEIDSKYREALRLARDSNRDLEGRRDLNQEEVDHIGKFNESMIKIGNEHLGVDLSGRITATEHIHVFPRQTDFNAAISGLLSAATAGVAIRIPQAGLLVSEAPSQAYTRYAILHEGVHDLSLAYIKPHLQQDDAGNVTVDIAKTEHIVGYKDMGGVGFNEAVTDMLTHRGIVDSGLDRIAPAYGTVALLLSGVIEDAAAGLRNKGFDAIRAQDVEDQITKGMLVDDTLGLKMINQGLAPNAVDTLMTVERSIQVAQAANVARAVRSSTAEVALLLREAEVDTGWFTWR
jgi:hypothetical protein